GNRNRQVVQRCEGLRVHHAGRRRQGPVRPSFADRRQRLQVADRGRQGGVRSPRGREGPRGDERRACRVATTRIVCPRLRAGARFIRGEGMAEKEDKIELEGEVVEAFRNGMYRIALDNGHETLGYTAGKMRRHRIRILPGDRIKVELSAYDLGRGRIVYRYR